MASSASAAAAAGAPPLPAAAATAAATTAKPTTVIELFPGVDEKDKSIPKPKGVVFSFGTAGFRTKVYLEQFILHDVPRLTLTYCICLVEQAHLLESTSFRMGLMCALRSYCTKKVTSCQYLSL